jgi:hypothetical protein
VRNGTQAHNFRSHRQLLHVRARKDSWRGGGGVGWGCRAGHRVDVFEIVARVLRSATTEGDKSGSDEKERRPNGSVCDATDVL